MLLWTLCFLFAFLGLRLAFADLGLSEAITGIHRERTALKRTILLLQEIEETLGAGLIPVQGRWDALRALPRPWGPLASESLQELRSRGGALVPTLKRLRALAVAHDTALGEARAKSAQALAQALFCSLLVPAFGSALYFLLPSVEERATLWLALCAGALMMAGLGALWMLRMAEAARWGGLPAHARPWALAAQCAGERFLSLVRSGNPPDLAWTRAHALLLVEAPGLATLWGASVWGGAVAQPENLVQTLTAAQSTLAPERGESLLASFTARGPRNADRVPLALRPLAEVGNGLRKAVQVSLMEGRPCTERAEIALEALRQELRSSADRELQLLGTRALQPLFACVAPALLGLLGAGLWISWEGVAGGGF